MKFSSSLLAIALGTAMTGLPNLASAQAATALPPGVKLVELFRWRNLSTTHHFTHHSLPWNWQYNGWRLDGTIGFVSSTAFEGSRPIYVCGVNPGRNAPVVDYFTSVDSNCEGHFVQPDLGPFIGFVAAYQMPGTVPLYRCDTPGHFYHFDTTSPTCEGHPGSVREAVLGYVF